MGLLAVLAALSLLLWLCVLLRPSRPYIPYADGPQGPAGDGAFGEALPPAGGPDVCGEGGEASEGPQDRPWRGGGLFERQADTRPQDGLWLASEAPLVSVVIPARNEEETVAGALRSHFRSTWTRLEVILVDDGSEDRTGAIAREAAAEASRPFVLLEGDPEVPAGWVGKVRAMARGVEAARGAYILFTDADIVFSPGLIARLVAESEARGLALNSRMVRLSAASFWERLLVPAFIYFFCLLYPFRAVEKRGSRTAAAAGGCMLVERRALECAGGMEGLKSAIIDDIALAGLLKGRGFPIRLTLTRHASSLRRYRRLADFWRTVSRTAFTELQYSWLRLGAATAALGIAFAAPLAAVGVGAAAGGALPALLGGAACALSWALYAPTVRFLDVPRRYVLLLPAAGILYLAMTWDSALRYAAGRRSAWKGRVYPR